MATATAHRPKPVAESHVALIETAYSGTPHTIDREAGVIRGVKVLGSNSQNGRTYGPKALSTAAKLYEGIAVFVDHPDRSNPGRERGIAERFGELRGAAVRGDAVYADLHFLKSHPHADAICESAERQPHHIGLSHNAVGSVIRRGNAEMVEDIERVRSVDIVTRPATNSSLFESQDAEDSTMTTAAAPVKKKLREIVESHSGGRGKIAIKRLLEIDGMEPEMAIEVPAEESGDDQVHSAFKAMIVAVLDDDSLDVAAKKKKIGEILAAEEKLTATADTPAESSDAPAESETPESVAELRRELNTMKAESAARSLLESAGVEITENRVKMIARLPESERKAAVAEFPKGRSGFGAASGGRPTQSAPLLESQSHSLPALQSGQAVAQFLRG